MIRLQTVLVASLIAVAALSGCSGKKSGDAGGEPNPAALAGGAYDSAIGNQGYRVTGSLTGPAAPLGADSAVRLDIVDNTPTDAEGAKDKATFVLDVKGDVPVVATLATMATHQTANASGDHFGGVGKNVQIFGSTGVGPSGLPQTTAYLFAAGLATLKIGDQVQSDRLVYVAVTQGLRDKTGAALTTPDAQNLQLQVLFPGTTMNNPAISGVSDGFLYYYFEVVDPIKLSDTEKADVGKTLREPPKANTPPVAFGKILVGGKPATSGAIDETPTSKKNLTVTFDASESKDAEGPIHSYVWRIGEMDANGTFVKPADPQPAVVLGKTAAYNFTQAGPKLVELTVIDNDRASATITLNFYVNFHKVYRVTSPPTQPAGGGLACTEAQNCFWNSTELKPGFVAATYKATPDGSSVTNGLHVEIDQKPPNQGGTAVKSANGDTLAVSAQDVKATGLGRYYVAVWWSAGAQVNYKLDATITYAPSVS